MSHRKHPKKDYLSSTPLASSSFFESQFDLNFSRISTNSGRDSGDKTLDLAYSKYLQSLMKNRIIKSSIRNFDKILQNQLDYRCEEIDRIKNECKLKGEILETTRNRNELQTILKKVEEKFCEFENTSGGNYNIKHLANFSNIFRVASKDSNKINVGRLDMDEWLILIQILNECCRFFKAFFKQHTDIVEFEQIDRLTEHFQRVLDLQGTIREKSNLKNDICSKYLRETADFFQLLTLMKK